MLQPFNPSSSRGVNKMKIGFPAFLCQTRLTVHAVTEQSAVLAAEGFSNKIRAISSVIGYLKPFQPIFFTGSG